MDRTNAPRPRLGLIGRGLLAAVALLVAIGVLYRMERTPLPNGLELGHRYIWDGRHDFYLWTKDGDLVAPYVLDLMCYNDRYLYSSTMDGPAFLYDIEDDVLTSGSDPLYYSRRRESGLSCSPEGATGYTQFLVGAGIIVHYPERVRDCTLSAPCPF